MIINELNQIINRNTDVNPLYLRNLLKESLQFYVLNFIYNSRWGENLLFKGGSCLRMFFDLPRLSEDLDLDFVDEKLFDLRNFVKDLEKYFKQTLQYREIEIKVSKRQNTIYLKFPILDKLGLAKSSDKTKILFLRIDLAKAIKKQYQVEISLKSTYDFSFLVKRYSISDLFAGKIAAILGREVKENGIVKPRIKGRDYFDLAWFLEKKINLNLKYLQETTDIKDKKDLKTKLEGKIKNLDIKILEQDLLPLFKDSSFVKNFCQNYKKIVLKLLSF